MQFSLNASSILSFTFSPPRHTIGGRGGGGEGEGGEGRGERGLGEEEGVGEKAWNNKLMWGYLAQCVMFIDANKRVQRLLIGHKKVKSDKEQN